MIIYSYMLNQSHKSLIESGNVERARQPLELGGSPAADGIQVPKAISEGERRVRSPLR